MRTRRGALLGELHAHTTWSDGALTLRELVDLTGVRGFDVLCVTDHVVRRDDPWLDETQRLETAPRSLRPIRIPGSRQSPIRA
jgi:histidinol phosphatase-like PHP family hydrolase